MRHREASLLERWDDATRGEPSTRRIQKQCSRTRRSRRSRSPRPVSTHHGLARRALEAGKHMLRREAAGGLGRRRGRRASRSGAPRTASCMAGHTFLYSPAVNMIRDQIQNDGAGETYFISMSRVNLGLHQTGRQRRLGPRGPRLLDPPLLAGRECPSAASAIGRSCVMPDQPDVAFVNLEFASGAIAHVELSWLAPASSVARRSSDRRR